MARYLTINEIRGLGFDWPKYELVAEYGVLKDGQLDLVATIEKMESSRAFYKQQINQAFAFKSQHGVDYSDFTDRHEEYAQQVDQFDQAIAYLNKILQAVSQL